MWILDNVNLNDELLTAQRNCKLVIFAGAGISVAPPSNFPNFADLAKKVNAIAANPLPFNPNKPIERLLGELKKNDINVHKIVQRELTNPESRPTELHSSILSLFNNPKDIKIVTTNFDLHFSTAACQMSLNVPIYKAPALPLGRDFNGIVYLHGSVEQEPEKLILTDEDFGQAYLTDGWATRFLADLFSSYTVLFIGYSHGDLIMQYLGRGLPLTSPRYALDKQGSDSNWNLFNIIPIEFPLRVSGNKYQALNDAVDAWKNLIQMDYIDHATKIRDITGQDPKDLGKQEEDYILYCLKDFSLTRIFTHNAKDFKWLEWLEERKIVDPLFNHYAQTTEIHSILARWVAQKFICNKSEDCLSMVQRKGQHIHAVLWSNIMNYLNYSERPEPAIFAKLVSVLLNSIPQQSDVDDSLTHLLSQCKHPEDASLIMLLFEFLMKPYMHLDKYINFHEKETEQKVDLEIKLTGVDFWLREAYQNIILPNLPHYADYLESIVTTNLRKAHHILRAAGKATADWDHKSFVRKAIELHSQDRYPGDFDILIDAAKNVIEYYAQNRAIRIRDVLETWFASDVPLLKRLAIHGLIETTSISAEDKILWVLEKDILFSLSMQHETYRLLESCYPIVRETMREAVVNTIINYIEINKIESDKENERIAYKAYNLLSWLAKSAECHLVTKELSKLQKQYSQFAPREHPDMLSWSTVGLIAPKSPLSAEKLIKSNLSTILSTIMSCDADPFSPEFHGLLIEIQTSVSQNFDWGLMLFKSLAKSDNVPSDIWSYIFLGWNNQDMPLEKWEELLKTFLENKHLHNLLCDHFSNLLNYKLTFQYEEFPKSLRKLALTLSKSIWENASTERPAEIINWFELSFGSPEGKIVEFWIKCLDEEIKIQGTRKLIPQFRTMFNQILIKKSLSASLGQVCLAYNLGFLASLDLDWTKKKLIPLFDWSNEVQAVQMWQGYLAGDPSGNVIKYLHPLYEQTFDKFALLGNAASFQFVHHVAIICVHSKTSDPLKGGWLIHFIKTCDQTSRISWADQVSRELTTLTEDEKLRIWNKWISQFLLLRLDGIPKINSDKELASFYQWAPALGLAFPHIVEVLTMFVPPVFEKTMVFHSILENKLHKSFPNATISLIAHILKSRTHSIYSNDLLMIYNELKQLDISAEQIRKLLNSLIQFGYLEIIMDGELTPIDGTVSDGGRK